MAGLENIAKANNKVITPNTALNKPSNKVSNSSVSNSSPNSISNSSPNSSPNSVSNSSVSNSSPKAIPNSKINAPSISNTSKQAIAIENNTVLKTANATADNTLKSAKEEAGVYEIVSENYILLLGVTSALIIIIIIYFFSQTFRVGRSVSQMEIYKQYLQLSSVDYSIYGNTRIGDYFISSAYNASHSGYQMYDYTSEDIVLAVLQSGARYLEFSVFNSEFGANAFPVVSMGYKLSLIHI